MQCEKIIFRMKLICETCIVNRSIPSGKKTFQKTILAIGTNSEKKLDEPVILLITNANKGGIKFGLKKNISKIFTRFLSEGKATISFVIPEQDLQIKSDVIQLTSFLKVLKSVLCGENNTDGVASKLASLKTTNINKSILSSAKVLSTKCVIKNRGDYPLKGFNRNLVSLQISDIKLIRFDPQIMLLKNLRTLNLSNNCIEKIPKELGLMRLSEIDLSGNALQKDRWEWIQLPAIQSSLQSLNIGSNNLSFFPIPLIYARVLIRLDLSENQLNKLPFAIWKMSRLRFLNLANNQLGSLPESMTYMRLEELNLSANQLDQKASTVPDLRVPSQLGQMPALWEIAARIVTSRKIHYSTGMIPFLLVELMHRTPICGCGLLCFTSKIYERAKVIKVNCQHLILNSNQKLYADSVFCSQLCSTKQ